MKKTTKFLSLFALVLCLVMALGVTASAAEVTVVDGGAWGGIDWTLTSDGTLTIAPTKGEPVPDENAPTKRTYEVGEWREAVVYNSKGIAQVEGGEPYAEYKNQITKLVIEEGVTSIGSFTGWLPKITGEVVIPSTVTYIGQDCFNGTPITKLTFAKVPAGQEGKEICIAHGAFKGLQIEEVTLPDDRPVHLHIWTFLNCKNLKHVTLPATITGMVGCNHIDYNTSMSAHLNNSWKGYSQIVGGRNNDKNKTIANPALETITFGSEAVKDLFFSYADNKVGADAKYGVAYVVNGAAAANMDGGIVYCTSLQAAVNVAQPGDIITLTSDTDEAIEIPVGVTLDLNGFNAPNVAPVAMIGEQSYTTLAAAIKDATAGQTITFVADITEDVTISKAITIDGADKNYTGTMTINNVTATIENVNFVKGQVYKHKSTGSTAKITIKNCDFDGQGLDAYAINLGATSSIAIENVTAKDYGYGLLQVPSSCAGLTVKNVNVSGCYYGFKVDYANAVTMEAVTMTDVATGIYDSNYGDKTYTIKDSKITTIKIWERSAAKTTTFEFEGVNEVTTLSTSAYAKYIGVQVGGKIYGTLADAFAAAQDGDTITLLGDIKTSEAITNTKNVTLALNGKTITGTDNATASFGLITNKGELTITGNGKMTLVATNNRAWNAYSSVISNTVGGKLVVENGTIEHLGGTDMAYAIDNLTNGKGTYAETVINGGTIKSTYRAIRQFLNGVEAQNILTVNGGTIEGANKSIWVQDPSAKNNTGEITVGENAILNGDVYLYATAGSAEWPVEVAINKQALNGVILTGNLPAGYTLVEGTKEYSVEKRVAWINKVGYFASLADAVEYVNGLNKTSSTYIELLCDSEGPGFVVKAPVEIKFNGYTYTITKGVGSTGTESNGIQQLSGKLVLRGAGTLKVADSIADKMYILVQSYDDLTVTGMILDGTNLDKWSKDEDQVVNGDSYVVSKNNGDFAINTTNIITNNDGSKAFAFDLCDQRAYGYMDLPYASVAATTTINGVPVKESLDKVEAVANYSIYYYATLEQAIAKHPSAALIGDVVLKDTVVIPEGKTFTLDLNGHTITMKTAEYKSAIENNGTLTIKDSGENGGIAMIFTGTPTTAKAVNAIANRGKLTVSGGNISNTGSGNQIGYAIDNYNGATLTVSGGNITASGSSYYDAIRLFCGSKATTVTVKGGYISSIWAQNPSANKASEVNGSVVVSGGEIGTIYYENYTTVTITTKIAGNYNVVAYGANNENATSAKVAKNTVYSFAN